MDVLKAKISRLGDSTIVELPSELVPEGKEIYVARLGDKLVFYPAKEGWESLFDSLSMFSDDFMSERLQPGLDLRVPLC